MSRLISCSILIASMSILSCKPKKNSDLKEIATSSSMKTGFFLPKIPADFAFRVKRDVKRLTPDELRRRCSQPEVENGRYSVTVTAEGEQILLLSTVAHEPMPVCSLEASNVVVAWSTFIAPANAKTVFLTDTWLRHRPDEKAIPWVSPDGNKSNMFMVRRPDSAAGVPEPMLINWVDHLQTASKAVLYRVGNAIIHAGVNNVAYSFSEIGNQVWQMKGFYKDEDVAHGTVFWSPDRVTFYSWNPEHNHLVQWKKQDKDSMDRVGRVERSAVKIPEIVKRAIDGAKGLSLATGDTPLVGQKFPYHIADNAHTYLYPWKGMEQGRVGSAFGLADDAPTAPANAEDFDAFFDPVVAECRANGGSCKGQELKSFALDGGGPIPSNFNALPRLDFSQGRASSGEGSYRYSIGARDSAGNPASVSGGNYFQMEHGGQKYLARMAVAPYSTLDSVTRPEDRWYSWNNTRTINERSEKVQLTMIPVDSAGRPIEGAQFRTATVDAFNRGITDIKTTQDVYQQHQRASQAVATQAQELIQQGRNQAATARADLDVAEQRYQDMTTVSGLTKRAAGEVLDAAGDQLASAANPAGQAFRGQAASVGRWAHNATGGRISATTAAEYSTEVMKNLVVAEGNNIIGTTVDAASGKPIAMGDILQQNATGIAQSFIPGSGFTGTSGWAGVRDDVARKLGGQVVSTAGDGIAGKEGSWTATGIATTGNVANQVLDSTIGKTGVPGKIVAAGLKYNVDQVTNIAEFNNARLGFEQSNATFSRASNLFMEKAVSDPSIHQSSAASFASDLRSSGYSQPSAAGSSARGSSGSTPASTSSAPSSGGGFQ